MESELKIIFKKYCNCKGIISKKKLVKILKIILETDIDELDLEFIIKKSEIQTNFNFQNFIKIYENILMYKNLLGSLKFLANDNKTINAKELINKLTNYGNPLTIEEAEELIELADIDNNNEINYTDFIQKISIYI